MSCYSPIRAWRDIDRFGGEGRIYFSNNPHSPQSKSLRLPCGGCVGCLNARSGQWALRCMHEASLHKENCFVTLTYDDAHLPSDGSLDKKEVSAFMKALRKAIFPRKVRFFCAGEYGSIRGRPHFHILLFGISFSDRYQCGTRGEYPVYRSPFLESIWRKGFSEIGTVTIESAGYVARYIMKRGKGAKKVSVDLESGEDLGPVDPEFALMSRNPGIGAGWIDKWSCDVYPRDGVVVRGSLCKPPRYYDLRVERRCPELVDGVRRRRKALADERVRRAGVFDDCESRLIVKEKVAIAKDSHIKRGDL